MTIDTRDRLLKPDQLAGFRIGDTVRLAAVSSPLTVIDFQPPSLLVLESNRGHQLRAGWRAVTLESPGKSGCLAEILSAKKGISCV